MAVTIKDVAKYAGVSTATVSRVINNDQGVKPENVKKVTEAIEACQFVPNFVARNLKNSRTNTVALIVSDISNPYFTAMAKAISDILRQHGYDMFVCSTEENKETEAALIHRFQRNHVDGIILNTTNQNDAFVTNLSKTTPIVLIERQILSSDFIGDFVGGNNFSGVYSMTQHLLRLGHKNIGFINSELSVNTGAERMAGFVRAMADAKITIDANYPYQFSSKHFNYEGGYAGAKHLMRMSTPPSAIIASNNMLALGALAYLKSANLRIPEDVSFFSHGDIQNSELLFVNPSFSTQNPYTLGERAASFIVSRIESPSMHNRQAIFESQLIIGDSVDRLS